MSGANKRMSGALLATPPRMTHPTPLPFDDDTDDADFDDVLTPPGPLGGLPLSHAEVETLTAPADDVEEPYEAALTVLRREGEIELALPDDGAAPPVANDEHLDVRRRPRRRA